MAESEVKPLEWKKRYASEFLSRAETIVGDYRVWTYHDADGEWFWALSDDRSSTGSERSEEAAKATCQADFERRVLSVLKAES